eukprot:923431-Amphidinium_carterae.1
MSGQAWPSLMHLSRPTPASFRVRDSSHQCLPASPVRAVLLDWLGDRQPLGPPRWNKIKVALVVL